MRAAIIWGSHGQKNGHACLQCGQAFQVASGKCWTSFAVLILVISEAQHVLQQHRMIWSVVLVASCGTASHFLSAVLVLLLCSPFDFQGCTADIQADSVVKVSSQPVRSHWP